MTRSTAFAFLTFALAAGASAQEPVPTLQDLIGERGTAVDGLEQRGYAFERGETSADSAYTYWTEQSSGRCIAARVTDGRVASVVYSDGDCAAREAVVEAGFFATVCGVIRGDQTYRYRCQAQDAEENGRRTTTLRLPDNEMQFLWSDDGTVVIERAGLAPESATYSTYEGETDIFTDEMTYFYISNREMAAWEIEHFEE